MRKGRWVEETEGESCQDGKIFTATGMWLGEMSY